MSAPAITVIAIDGPAGSGKSTVARSVAKRVGIEYLDTGAMYRAVAHAAVKAGVPVDDEAAVAAIAEQMELTVSGGLVEVNGEDATDAIRSPAASIAVTAVAANPAVRREMRRRQRAWAQEHGGGVMEGRDIGTIVFPDAIVKVYLTASIAERARRRSAQSGQDVEEVEADMRRRDLADKTRRHGPLARAEDAIVVDTTDLTTDEVVEVIAGYVEDRRTR